MSRAKKSRKISKKQKKRLTMEQIAQLPSVQEMWEPWCLIAKELIPDGFDIGDAAKGSLPPGEINEGWVKNRMEYLSDRADPSRSYWLDYAIRVLLGKPRPRNKIND